MKRQKGVTLLELLIAIAMVAILVAILGSTAASLYAMKKDILDKQGNSIRAQLAMATIFERVLRAAATTTTTTGGPTPAAFKVYDSNGNDITDTRAPGVKITYKTTAGVTQTIWKEGSDLKYDDGSYTRTLLKDIAQIAFSKDYQNRLGYEVTLQDGQRFKTCVQPRNEFTVRGTIN